MALLNTMSAKFLALCALFCLFTANEAAGVRLTEPVRKTQEIQGCSIDTVQDSKDQLTDEIENITSEKSGKTLLKKKVKNANGVSKQNNKLRDTIVIFSLIFSLIAAVAIIFYLLFCNAEDDFTEQRSLSYKQDNADDERKAAFDKVWARFLEDQKKEKEMNAQLEAIQQRIDEANRKLEELKAKRQQIGKFPSRDAEEDLTRKLQRAKTELQEQNKRQKLKLRQTKKNLEQTKGKIKMDFMDLLANENNEWLKEALNKELSKDTLGEALDEPSNSPIMGYV